MQRDLIDQDMHLLDLDDIILMRILLLKIENIPLKRLAFACCEKIRDGIYSLKVLRARSSIKARIKLLEDQTLSAVLGLLLVCFWE